MKAAELPLKPGCEKINKFFGCHGEPDIDPDLWLRQEMK
ncbi:MAG: hypothetical protein KatS3mg109_0403 [Pirellulaceae bacterium]|nr:MAG: hypothetical protein KatS3mg109_0403 [Pirellulaceae bacterium]